MKKLVCIVWIACLYLASMRAKGGPLVFQIGTADGDYHEFAIAGKHVDYQKQFPNDVNFVVGQSDAARDWPYVLPGPYDGWAGSKAHTFTIHFQVPQSSSGYYQFVIDFVSTHPSGPPTLDIGINGEHIQHKLPRGSTDDALADPKSGKHSSIQEVFPATLLHEGDNTISLTGDEGSWVLFDDVRLESGAAAPAQPFTMNAEAMPFFKRTSEGPRRVVRVSIENLETASATAELSWRSQGLSGSQQFTLHFGSNEQVVPLPDVKHVELTLHSGSKESKLALDLPPARRWKLYIVPTTHTDIGYTDFQDRVKVRHADNGMHALDLFAEYPFFKWYSETFWQLNALLDLHPDKTDAVFDLLRQKRWGLSGDYANMLTGLCSSEALNRVTLDSRNLARRGHFPLDSVVLDDVPSAIGTLPMVLANSGIHYFIEGANRDRAPYAGNEPNPFYWEGVDGSRVLAEITHQPGYGAAGNLVPNMKRAMEQLPPFLARFESNDYPYDAVLLNGAFGDNHPIESWLPKMVEEWNSQWAYPQLILALPADYFGYIEKNFSNSIPVLKTDFGGWWEDGAGSSALETTLSRRAEERAVTAEMLHSLAGIIAGAAYPKSKFDDVWHNVLLYNEHTWGAAGSIRDPEAEQTVKQWEVKASFAHASDAESRELLKSGMDRLASMAPPADWIVFNSLDWSRKALVTVESGAAVQDVAAKKTLACQTLPEGGSCFIADDLPPVGYRSYREVKETRAGGPDAVQISGNQMENEFYRVTFNPKTGGVQSIYDKESRCELVDPDSDLNLGELVYVTGGEGTSAIHSDLERLPPPHFEHHRQTGTGYQLNNGPVFGEVASHATNMDFPGITLRVRLYHGLKQLDLIFELDKSETLAKEAAYLAFPFALDAQKGGLWLEYPDEITEPAKDQHASACRDWYSAQRWLAVSDGANTVELSPLDAPLFTLGGMTASTWPRQLLLHRGHVFGYILNNYWHTNYKARQGGRLVFRYSLTSRKGPFSKRRAVADGWNMYCPAVAGRGQTNAKPVLSAPARSLLTVEPAGLPLTTIKGAEDQSGFVFRCCDYSGAGGTARLTLPLPASEAFKCDLVEDEMSPLNEHGTKIKAPIKPFGVLTLEARFGAKQ